MIESGFLIPTATTTVAATARIAAGSQPEDAAVRHLGLIQDPWRSTTSNKIAIAVPTMTIAMLKLM